MNKRIVIAALAAAALAVPTVAAAQPGNGKGHAKKERVSGKAKKVKKAKKVTFVFKGTFTAPGTVQVLAGNAHARKGGFVGQTVAFDFATAKVVVADTNGDLALNVTDVKDGDLVLVQARLAKRTKFAPAATEVEAEVEAGAEVEAEVGAEAEVKVEPEALVARKLVDKTNPPVEVEDTEL